MTFPGLALSLMLAAATALGGCAIVTDQANRREAFAEATHPPGGGFVTVDGLRIHAVTQGHGPDVILIHGAGGSTRDMTFSLSGKLAKHYRVTSFDRPGFGYSDSMGKASEDPLAQADVLIAAAKKLGLRNPVVVGHSYGGAVAMAWALRDPAHTRGLVILSGATMPFPGDLSFWYRMAASPAASATLVPLISAFATDGLIDNGVTAIFKPDPVPAGYLDYFGPRLTLRRTSMRDNGEQVVALKRSLVRMEPHYRDITMPVEILHGLADVTVPASIHAERLAKDLPNAHLVLIPGAGHMIHQIHGDLVVAAVDRVIAQSSGPR